MASSRAALALAVLAAAILCLCTLSQQTLAQAPAAAPPAAQAAEDMAAKAAFEALPEADRKAIQEALVWSGDYAGISDGTFGKGTLNAIKAFQTRAKAKSDGILQQAQTTALLAEGARARQAVGFTQTDDAKSGVRIGVPLKLLDQRAMGPSGTSFKAKDGSTTLETFTVDPGKTTLADVFQRLTQDPARHVTYKVLRGDFLVVTGEAGGKRFFERVASGPTGLRGFVFSYPPRPAFDHMSVAIANSFVPFPGSATAASGATTTPASITPGQAPHPHPQTQISAIAIGPKEVLTTALPQSCTAPMVAGSPAKVLRSDAALGLALLERGGAEVQAPALALGSASTGAEVVVLSAKGDGEANVLVASGETPSASRILAPLQAPSGSAVFDRSGALAGMVAYQANVHRLPEGIVPAASYAMIDAQAIKRFLASANAASRTAEPGSGDATAGELAAKYGKALASVGCGS